MRVKIRRFAETSEYFISVTERRATILDVLEAIKNNLDITLSYRAQCRAAICGTCGVKVNGKMVLACKTKVLEVERDEGILIEPLDNMEVIKDLVVDHGDFISKLRDAKSWYIEKEQPEKVYPEDLANYERETDCILCGICYSVCPAFQNDKEFGGPINFVKMFRFWKDKNDALGDVRVEIANKNNITSCVHCRYCTLSCPKQIPVEEDILQIEFYGKQKGIIQKKENFPDFFSFGF
ncbi:MAG: 2Fe-2S iron-sulfur cluster-binding protein [Hydrogenothermaceae bacterium]|nr:2Fe-2S iron-sulfur cluster-binding protein [Hydrogenothermaceae bacterium]